MVNVKVDKEENRVLFNKEDLTAIVVLEHEVQIYLKNAPDIIHVTSETMTPVEIFEKIESSMQCNAEQPLPYRKLCTTETEIKGNCFCYTPEPKEKPIPMRDILQSSLGPQEVSHYTKGTRDAVVKFTVITAATQKEIELIALINDTITNHNEWNFERAKDDTLQLTEQKKSNTLGISSNETPCYTPEGKLMAAARAIDFIRHDCARETKREITIREMKEIIDAAIGILPR
ncbi:hypothetical protein [Enterobacter sp. CGMCC 5087]|uniref:hypothetical protein n=1 Tax=Enterobacter sp. CGMCC 5087 TaxID=2183878 RepID=UPI000D6E237D|nr:hypothetical protein [Enterobacter sp. CGMCC 5087]